MRTRNRGCVCAVTALRIGISVIMQQPDLIKGFDYNLKQGPGNMRNLLLILMAASLLLAGVAHAQLRTLPANAKRATVGQPQQLPYVDLGGKVVRLAPGGVIYDQHNRSIVHGALPPGADVAFTIDMHGDIARIYILTPHEQARLDQKK